MDKKDEMSDLPWLSILAEGYQKLQEGFKSFPENEVDFPWEEINHILQITAERLWDNYPYQHPQYIGHMMKPPHPLPWLAYILSMVINPNNQNIEGGRASTNMEKEAISYFLRLFNWNETGYGHLTSGGTTANLEALWIARQEMGKEKSVVASSMAHYTHPRMCKLLDIPYHAISVDGRGRMDLASLENTLAHHQVGTVVVTLGNTSVGSVDPLPEILKLQKKYSFRIHVDAAYGGFFMLLDKGLDPEVHAAFESINQADSIVIDPHKHGLQPYGCGAVFFQNRSIVDHYYHDSPYTYFSTQELHLGKISLECSRSGNAAVAFWATLQMFPLEKGGRFAKELFKSRQAALDLYKHLQQEPSCLTILPPDLDIVIWIAKPSSKTISVKELSEHSLKIYETCLKAQLYPALLELQKDLVIKALPEAIHWNWDQETLMCLRSVQIKPEHLSWQNRIWDILQQAMKEKRPQ